MTPKLPRLTVREMLSILNRHGFETVRTSGSHRILRDQFGHRTVVPFHTGKILHPKLVRSILHQTGLSIDDIIKQ